MAEYKVAFEIQVDAESPLEAAKTVDVWLKEPGTRHAYVVQQDDDEENSPIYLVDLVDLEKEKEDGAVLQLYNHKPLIS